MTEMGCLASYGYRLSEGYAIARCLDRKDANGGAAGRDAGPAADPVRAGDQPESGACHRHRDPTLDPRPRRRGHRVAAAFTVNNLSFCAQSASARFEVIAGVGQRLPKHDLAMVGRNAVTRPMSYTSPPSNSRRLPRPPA